MTLLSRPTAKNDIQRAGVQYILDSVVDELVKDPARRSVTVMNMASKQIDNSKTNTTVLN